MLVAALASMVLAGTAASARAQSAIAGVVRDSSGAVLPGVTDVEFQLGGEVLCQRFRAVDQEPAAMAGRHFRD